MMSHFVNDTHFLCFSVCETVYHEYEVEEDIPVCQEVVTEQCMTDEYGDVSSSNTQIPAPSYTLLSLGVVQQCPSPRVQPGEADQRQGEPQDRVPEGVCRRLRPRGLPHRQGGEDLQG